MTAGQLVRGTRVRTPKGPGGVLWIRMAPPTYATVEAVSVFLDCERHRPGYAGTVYPVGDIAIEPVTSKPDRGVRAASAPQLVTADDVQPLVDRINDGIRKAHAREVDHHLAHEAPYSWEAGKSVEEIRAALLDVNNAPATMTDRKKYIAIDRDGGRLLVDKTDGQIYGIKGYGVPHKRYRFGTVHEPKLIEMTILCFGAYKGRFVIE